MTNRSIAGTKSRRRWRGTSHASSPGSTARRSRVRLAALSEGERETLRLRYTEGLSRGEIAEVLAVPVSTVKSRLFEPETESEANRLAFNLPENE